MSYGNGTRAPSLEAQVLYRQARELAGIGRYDEAVRVFRNVVMLAPRFTRALMEMGTCLESLGRYPEARAAYNRVKAIDPWMEEASVRWDKVAGMNGTVQPGRQNFTGQPQPVAGSGTGRYDYSLLHSHAAVAGIHGQEATISPLQAG